MISGCQPILIEYHAHRILNKGARVQWASISSLHFHPHLFPTQRRSLVMSFDKEKDQDLIVQSKEASSFEGDYPTFYDPSKESVWTRIGLSLESFKRAPGVTR